MSFTSCATRVLLFVFPRNINTALYIYTHLLASECLTQCILESFLLSVSAGDQFRLQSLMIYTSYLPKKSKKSLYLWIFVLVIHRYSPGKILQQPKVWSSAMLLLPYAFVTPLQKVCLHRGNTKMSQTPR